MRLPQKIPDQVEDKLHTGKAVVQITAIEVAVDYLLDIRPPEAVLSGGILVICRNTLGKGTFHFHQLKTNPGLIRCPVLL